MKCTRQTFITGQRVKNSSCRGTEEQCVAHQCVCVCVVMLGVVSGLCELSKESVDAVWALIYGVVIVSSCLPEGEFTNTPHLP